MAPASAAQGLPDTLVQQIRAGAAGLILEAAAAEVPLLLDAGVPIVEVTVNGHGPYRFLIDLGANVVIVRRNVLEEAGGQLLIDRETTDIGLLHAVGIGPARLEHVVAGVYDDLDVDGVIGYNALRHSSFTLDYPRKRFVMHRRFLSAPDGQRILGYTVVGRMPYVTVELHGRPLLMNLDTGASEWMTIPPALTDSLVWQSSPRPGRITRNNQTGATRVLEGTAAGVFTLGPIRITEPLVYVNPDADDAWLGSSAMRGAAWTFDVVNRRVAITLGERP